MLKRRRLPLDPVLVAISELLPKIQETQPKGGAPSSKVFNILKDASLEDVLPPATPIIPRRFQVSFYASIEYDRADWSSGQTHLAFG